MKLGHVYVSAKLGEPLKQIIKLGCRWIRVQPTVLD